MIEEAPRSWWCAACGCRRSDIESDGTLTVPFCHCGVLSIQNIEPFDAPKTRNCPGRLS